MANEKLNKPVPNERMKAQAAAKAKVKAKNPDQAKAQNAAKLKKTVVESGNKSGKLATAKDIKKATPNKGNESLIQNITNRYRVTAREARDIVTAVGTLGKTRNPKFASDVVKQVKEVGTAATTGAKGESAYVTSKNNKNATKVSRKKFEEGKSTGVSTKGKLM